MLRVTRAFLLPWFISASLVVVAGGPVNWVFSTTALQADSVQLQLRSTCEAGWHIYALHLPSDEGPLPTAVKLDAAPAFSLAGPVVEPVPLEKEDPAFGMRVRYHEGETTFTQNLIRGGRTAFTVHGSVEYMACNDKTCLPPTQVEFTVDIPPARSK